MSYPIDFTNSMAFRWTCPIQLQLLKPINPLKDRLSINCIIDTGCINTLIPTRYANSCGIMLNKRVTVIVGGKEYVTCAYLFENVYLGDFNIKKMVAFSGEYKGELAESVLLGSNFLCNLNFTMSKNENRMTFDYDAYNIVKAKEHPFIFFFDRPNSRPVYPNLLNSSEVETLSVESTDEPPQALSF